MLLNGHAASDFVNLGQICGIATERRKERQYSLVVMHWWHQTALDYCRRTTRKTLSYALLLVPYETLVSRAPGNTLTREFVLLLA